MAASKRCSARRATQTTCVRADESYGTPVVTRSLYAAPMERMLLLWDELDDLLGVGACLVSRAVMRMTLLGGTRRS
jgi:hypothetical protein